METASLKPPPFAQYAAVVLSERMEHARVIVRSVAAGRVLMLSVPIFSISIFVSSYLAVKRERVSVKLVLNGEFRCLHPIGFLDCDGTRLQGRVCIFVSFVRFKVFRKALNNLRSRRPEREELRAADPVRTPSRSSPSCEKDNWG
jgi:hypothetical protein